MPKNPHQDNAKAKPKAKDRRPVEKHNAPNDKWATTFVILAAFGAVAIALLTHYGLETPLVWASFLTGAFLIVAIHFHWRSQAAKTLCVVAGLLLFLGCLIWQYRLSFPKQQIPTVLSMPVPTPTPNLREIPKIGASPSTATNGREFLDIDPEKLFAFFEKYNDAQAEGLVRPYIGKWLEMQGRVTEVTSDDFWDKKNARFISGISVRMETARGDKKESTVWTRAEFDEQRWIDRAFVLKKDEDIKVRGQIKYIFARSFRLQHCEIIE